MLNAYFSFNELKRYSPAEVEALKSAGIMISDGIIPRIQCNSEECFGTHHIDYLTTSDPPAPYYECRKSGDCFWPSLEEITQWSISCNRIAEAISRSLPLGSLDNVGPGAWRIGTLTAGIRTRDLFFIGGNFDPGAVELGTFAGGIVIAIADRINCVGVDADVILLASEVLMLDETGLHLRVGRLAVETDPRSTPDIPSAGVAVLSVTLKGNVLHRHGALWTISFANKTIALTHTVGLVHLAFLIEHQGTRHLATHLVWSKDKSQPVGGARHRAAQALEDSLTVSKGALGSGNPNARSSVTQRVNEVLAKIKPHHPLLYDHLKANVKLGDECYYDPPMPTPWKILQE